MYSFTLQVLPKGDHDPAKRESNPHSLQLTNDPATAGPFVLLMALR